MFLLLVFKLGTDLLLQMPCPIAVGSDNVRTKSPFKDMTPGGVKYHWLSHMGILCSYDCFSPLEIPSPSDQVYSDIASTE